MKGLAEWGCGRAVVEGGGQTGAQQPIIEADKEQGGSEPGIADAVAMAAPAAEQALFREAAKRVSKSRYLHNVPCGQLLAVAEEMLQGEIAYRRGDHDAAFARLRAAVVLEGRAAL